MGTTTYGSCKRSQDYDIAFGIAFIFTRLILVVMYGLYFFVFHESNIIGHAPSLDKIGIAKDLHFADIVKEDELETIRRTVSRTADESEYIHSKDGSELSAVVSSTHTIRESLFQKMLAGFRETIIQEHFTKVFLMRVVPAIISSLAMLMMIFGMSPVIALPIVAGIEFVGDFAPSFCISPKDWKELKPARRFYQERLGLFFMLVLGEGILGFGAVDYGSGSVKEVYKVIL